MVEVSKHFEPIMHFHENALYPIHNGTAELLIEQMHDSTKERLAKKIEQLSGKSLERDLKEEFMSVSANIRNNATNYFLRATQTHDQGLLIEITEVDTANARATALLEGLTLNVLEGKYTGIEFPLNYPKVYAKLMTDRKEDDYERRQEVYDGLVSRVEALK